MPELTPKDTVRILGECVEALSEISRDPAVYGDAAAALALGTLCFYADPAKVVGRSAENLPDGGFVVFAVTGHLDANRARQLAKGSDLFRNAAQSVKPFLARVQHLLVKAGQTFPVATVLERARARHEQAAAQVVGITVPELDPAPYTTLVGVMRPNARGEIELDSGVPDEPAWKPSPEKTAGPLREKSQRNLKAPPPPPDEGEAYVIGERDDALCTDDRVILRGFRADQTTPVSFQEYKSTHLMRDDFKEELEAWVRKLQQVHDAHAVGVLGIHRAQSKLYLVYEEMQGQTLHQLLSRGPLDEADVMSTLESLALGLKAYHGAGAIHKGLRPDRVLIDRDGTVRVFDPPPPRPPRPAGEEETLREKGLKGEVRYMSPEVCTAADGHTPAADVYSLGLMVCEMLLGEQNLQRIAGETVRFWLNWHVDLYKKAVPLTEIDPEISAELSEVVSKMLEKRVKNRYQDCGQVLQDLAAFRSGRKKAPKANASQSRPGVGRATRSAQALGGGGFGAMMEKAGVTPRTLGLAGAVGFMFLLCVVAGIFVAFRGEPELPHGGGQTADEPCKKAIEDALVAFRKEDFDATQKKIEELAKTACGPVGEQSLAGLKSDLVKARELKIKHRDAMKAAVDAEAAGKTGVAITQYEVAAKSYKDLSTTIQHPERPLPDDLKAKLDALEPVRLLEDAKASLKADNPDDAKHTCNLIIENHAGSPVAREAEELAKTVVQVKDTMAAHNRQFELGREADGTGKYFEAATCYWNAKNAWEMAQRLSGANKPLPADLRDRMTAVYPKVWSVRSPAPDALVENEDLVFEIVISEKFFREVAVGKKSLPVKGEFMTVKMSELGAGSHIVEVSALSVDGQRSMRKLPFRFQPPEEHPPKIEVKSISGTKDSWIADIEYAGTPYTGVQVGWKPPDGKFTVLTLTGSSLTVQTQKKNRFFYQP